MNRLFIPTVLGIVILGCFFTGCKKESDETIESVPVEEIPISQPPEVQLVKPAEPKWNIDGVWKVEKDLKYYNAVVPLGAIEISANEQETRFYVKNMDSGEAKKFIAKYFPYQNMKYFPAVDLIELYQSRNPQYDDDSVVPDLDPDIVKPEPGQEVAITVYWSSRNEWYEWVYRDPFYNVPAPEIPEQEKTPEEGNYDIEPANIEKAEMMER